jgi:hypothetical protein
MKMGRTSAVLATLATFVFVAVSMAVIWYCGMHVPLQKVYGTYLARYPYGTDTIKLKPDGSFVQQVSVNQEKPVFATGRWEFDPNDSRVTFYGVLLVDNGFGNLRNHWELPAAGLVDLSVEMHWFRVVIGSGDEFPFFKQ